jgi:hypothetical protein
MIATLNRKELAMIYVGYQATPVSGKLQELKACHKQLRDIAETNGARQVAGFEVTLGQAPGSLVYIVAYDDADCYVASTNALAQAAAWQEAEGLIASSNSAVLQPLPYSQIQ